jgi:hypothetical protein
MWIKKFRVSSCPDRQRVAAHESAERFLARRICWYELCRGDTIQRQMTALFAIRKTIPTEFPKGYWIVYLQPSIPRFGHITIMAFSKDNLALVYFEAVNDNG